jgi:hypothetical protein
VPGKPDAGKQIVEPEGATADCRDSSYIGTVSSSSGSSPYCEEKQVMPYVTFVRTRHRVVQVLDDRRESNARALRSTRITAW